MDVAYCRKVLESVRDARKKSKRHFDMGSWLYQIKPGQLEARGVEEIGDFCGTSACLAGQAVLLDSELATINWNHKDEMYIGPDADRVQGSEASTITLRDGRVVEIEERGAELMGLEEAQGLFYMDNDDEALKALEILIDKVDSGMSEDQAWDLTCTEIREARQ